MTVYELCELYVNSFDEIEIWSCYREETVDRGTPDELQCGAWANYEVLGLDVEDEMLVINI